MSECNKHKGMEMVQYCYECKQFMCVFCNIEHKKENPSHKIDAMSNILVTLLYDLEITNPSISSIENIQAEYDKLEFQMNTKLTKLRNRASDIKAAFIKIIDDCMFDNTKKIKEFILECKKLKNKIYMISNYPQKKEKTLEKVIAAYNSRKYSEIIEMINTVKKMNDDVILYKKNITEQVKTLHKDSSEIVEICEDQLGDSLEKIREIVMFALINLKCCKCSKKISHKIAQICTKCKNNKELMCTDCAIKCHLCSDITCQKCSEECKFCGKATCNKCSKKRDYKCNLSECNILNLESWKKLKEISGKEFKINSLLFKASRDGFNRSSFHKLCDQKGPTLTVIKSQHDKIFGGYVSKDWASNGEHVEDLNSFIFSLSENKKYERTSGTSMYCGSDNGVWFGACYIGTGNVKDNWNTDRSSCLDYSLSSTSYFTKSEHYLSGSTDSYFTVKEVEVYQVNI